VFGCSLAYPYWNVGAVMVDRDYFPNPGCFGLLALCVLVLASLACGTQIPENPSTGVSTETPVTTYPVKVLASDPTDTAPQYMTTGALNVRSEPNADSEILGTLAPFTEIQIFITYEKTDGCYLGEWYQIFYKPEGGEIVKAYVCSLWVVRK